MQWNMRRKQPVSSAGMEPPVDRFESVGVDMGIDLGGGNVGMAKHHLDRTEIRAAGQ